MDSTTVDVSPILQAVVGLAAAALTAFGGVITAKVAQHFNISMNSTAMKAFDDALTRAIQAGAADAQAQIAIKGWDHIDVKNEVLATAASYAINKSVPALKGIGLDPNNPATSTYLRAELGRMFPAAMAQIAASPTTPPTQPGA